MNKQYPRLVDICVCGYPYGSNDCHGYCPSGERGFDHDKKFKIKQNIKKKLDGRGGVKV